MSIGILWDLLYYIIWFASSIENDFDRRLFKRKKEYSITVLSLQTNTTNAQKWQSIIKRKTDVTLIKCIYIELIYDKYCF